MTPAIRRPANEPANEDDGMPAGGPVTAATVGAAEFVVATGRPEVGADDRTAPAGPAQADPEATPTVWRRVVPDRIRGLWARIPARVKFVVGLFLGAKLVITVFAVLVLHVSEGNDFGSTLARRQISSHRFFSFWFNWDSYNYFRMESPSVWGPHPSIVTYSFFPLYPLVSRIVGLATGDHFYFSLLVVSNVAFLATLYYAYRLGELLLGDERQARVFTRYIVLMPAAFLFQAALTESLFMGLALAGFYYAERRRWLLVGILGFFLALTRSPGFAIALPLFVLLLQQGGYRWNAAALRGYLRSGWPLLLVPAGLATYLTYCRITSGDWLIYQHVQQGLWGIRPIDPVRWLWAGLHTTTFVDRFRVAFALACVVLALIAIRYVKPAYWAYALVYTAVPLTIGGPTAYQSVIRYLLVIFPVALMFTRWVARRPAVDGYLTAVLAFTQGIMLVLWLASYLRFII